MPSGRTWLSSTASARGLKPEAARGVTIGIIPPAVPARNFQRRKPSRDFGVIAKEGLRP